MSSTMASLADRLATLQQLGGRTQKKAEVDFSVFENMSLEELEQQEVSFGKTHVGKSFKQVWDHEQRWILTFSKTWGDSQKLEHRIFLLFVQRMVEQCESEAMATGSVDSSPWVLTSENAAIPELEERIEKLEKEVAALRLASDRRP